MLDENSKEDMAIKAGLLMAKRDLEIKTGKVDPKSKDKKSNQEDILKKIKDMKKQKKTIMSGDLFVLKRSYYYTPDINPEEVLEVVKEKLWDSPKDINLLNICGVAYMVIGDYYKAEFEFKKAMNVDKSNKDILYNSAELAMRKGNTTDALLNVTNLLKKDRDDLDALYMMGLILYLKNSYEQAGLSIAQALKADKLPDRVHKYFAFLSILKKNIEKCEEELLTSVEKDVSYLSGRLAYAHILLYKKNVAAYELESKLIESAELPIQYQPCKLVNDAIYNIQLDNRDKADELLTEAWQKNNRCLCSMVEKARMLFDEGKFEESYMKLKKASFLSPNSLLILSEILKTSYYVNLRNIMNLELEMEETVNRILTIRKDVIVKIHNKGNTITKFELMGIRENFNKNLQIILSKYKEETPYVNIECEEEMVALKMMRNLRLCEMKCIDEK